MYYSDEEFAVKVDEKLGNVRFFKRCLRDNGLIGTRQQLSDEHVPIFQEVCKVRDADRSTWELAIEKVLKEHLGKYIDEDTPGNVQSGKIEGLLESILEVLERIEKKMG